MVNRSIHKIGGITIKVEDEKLLADLIASEEGSMEEKVCMDIFMNTESHINSINFVRAFHGPIIRDDAIMILRSSIVNNKEDDIRKSQRFTIPNFLKQIKKTLKNYNKNK